MVKEYDKVTCIEFLNRLLELLFGKDNGGNNNGGEDKPPEFGICKDIDILNFWKKHKVVWACDQTNFGMEDEWFHFPLDVADWLEWAYEALDQCPPYTSNSRATAGFDCDDFADFLPAWCKAKHGANAIWEVWGDTPQGGHAWNAIMSEEGMYEIEPQNGECWPFGTNSQYKAILAK